MTQLQSLPLTETQTLQVREVQDLHRQGNLPAAAVQYAVLLESLPQHPPLLAGLAHIKLQQGDYQHAAQLLADFIERVPDQPYAYCDRGVALSKLQRWEEAVASYDQALALKSDLTEAWYNRGVALQDLRRYEQAVSSYDQAIAVNPQYVKAFNNRGLALQALNQLDAALLSFQQAIALKADYAEAYNNAGNCLLALQRPAEALLQFAQAIAIKPQYAVAYNNRGNALLLQDQAAAALASISQAIALKADYAEAYFNRGLALQRLQRQSEALASYQQALALKADYAEACNNCGSLLLDMQRQQEALAYFEQAIAFQPDYAQAHNNRGIVLRDLQQLEAALQSFAKALVLQADFAEAYANYGTALNELGRKSEAEAYYRQAIDLDAESVSAHLNLALLKLQTGDFLEGWHLYEWRWRETRKQPPRVYPQPLWLGEESLAGKTLLIHPEQGFGDFIQFCRYLPLLEPLGATLLLEAPTALATLAKSLPGQFSLLESGQPLPAFDYHIPLLSLPLALKTTLDSIPNHTPYLASDAQRQACWHDKLGPKIRRRVGLVWSGAAFNSNDGNRSIPLKLLAPLLALPFEFHALQKEYRAEDSALLAEYPQLHLHHAALTDFAETAALINEMDLVISVCTSVAHLAGALAKPVWVMLPFSAHFVWLTERTDSPWYPTARLYRQPATGDWSSVVAALMQDLSV